MTRLDRYVLAQVFWPGLLALVAVTFLGVAQELRERLGEIPAEFLTAWDIVRLALFLSPLLIPIVAPVAFFFGVLSGCSRLAAHGEITAIKAAGVSMFRLSLPIVGIGVALSGLAFFIQDQFQPRAIRYAYAVMFEELPGRLRLETLPPGVMHDFAGWKIYFAERDSESGVLHDLDIVSPAETGSDARVLHARSARVRSEADATVLELNEGYSLPADQLFSPFERLTLRITHGERNIPERQLSRLGTSVRDLLAREAELSEALAAGPSLETRTELFKVRRELGDRLSFPFAAFGVGLVGAGTALRVRKAARARSFAIGFLVMLGYFLVLNAADPVSLVSLPETVARGWLPNALLYAFGFVQLLRIDRI